MINVLIICTGNSCRSIIGEALLNHLGSGRFKTWSAGSYPTGLVNPNAISTLKAHDLLTDSLSSKSWDALDDIEFDIVISVCDNARGETCPAYLNQALKVHWGLPDPAHIVGTEKEINAAFESTFSALTNRITMMLDLPLEQLSDKELASKLNEIGNLQV
jgi:arsenate reductase (thioredoxin)